MYIAGIGSFPLFDESAVQLLANLPKLEKLCLIGASYICSEIFKYFKSLKSLELDHSNVTDAALACISEYCLELQYLRIECKYKTFLYMFVLIK